MKKIIVFISISFIVSLPTDIYGMMICNADLQSQQTLKFFDNNINIRKAHLDILSLKTVSAEKLLDEEEKANPDNAYLIYYRFFKEVILVFISNSPEKYKNSAPKLTAFVERLEKTPAYSPEHLLFSGNSRIFNGLLKIKYANRLIGLFEFLKGYKLLESNKRLYPDFQQSKELTGIIHVALSFMPRGLQFAVKILGIKGDPDSGLKELSDFSDFASGKPGLEEEAFLMTLLAYKIMGQDEMFTSLIKNKVIKYNQVVIFDYLASTVCLESNQGELAFEFISGIKTKELETPFPSLYYILGKAKLYRLDTGADTLFHHFLEITEGPDYIKATLYNLAIFYFAHGQVNNYRNFIKQLKTKGRELNDRDIEAQWEANQNRLPNYHLLRTELLTMGGYTQKAIEEINLLRDWQTMTLEDQGSYHFLLGENYRLTKKYALAEEQYLKAYLMGREKGFHTSLESLVQLGLMKEKNAQPEEAEKYYRQCIQFKSNENPYSDMLTNKARAGIIRLKNRVKNL